jgi:nitrite reductase/ring-hydroxylating ferredoxin subunit/uncharacterized membrane protein
MPVRLQSVSDRVEALEALDEPAGKLADLVGRVVPHGPVKDALSGTWLGHPVHPLLTDVPIGAWTSALLLDLLGGESGRDAARTLIGVGIVASVPTALAGASDFADTAGGERRVGVLHAACNSLALLAFAGSWLVRRKGHGGVGLGMLGGAAVAAGGFLGGHLSYALGVGVDNTIFEHLPDGWTPILAADELEEGKPVKAEVSGVPVVVVREGGRITALANTCTHRGGPLDEGEVRGDCITCPWHGSTFRLEDGEVATGPAVYRQPALEVRETKTGKIEVRPRPA